MDAIQSEHGCILSMLGMSKTYPGVEALKNVSFSAYEDEIHSLVEKEKEIKVIIFPNEKYMPKKN